MRMFLDTASIAETQQGVRRGIVSRVMANPSLIARESPTFVRHRVQEVCSFIDRPASIGVFGEDLEGVVQEARERARRAPNVGVELPRTATGLEAISVVSREGIRVTQTLRPSAEQALPAAPAGARAATLPFRVFVRMVDRP